MKTKFTTIFLLVAALSHHRATVGWLKKHNHGEHQCDLGLLGGNNQIKPNN